jgi:asparagine synthase (glutamine-hydrolysing)
MCGFTGILDFRRQTSSDALAVQVTRMRDTLVHRGPDDAGTWVDASAGIALGHRRLSIIDLSPLGHQPMDSASGRYVVAYNGEIYNFRELRKELEAGGAIFRGHSDTEVLLAGVERWGVALALTRFNGMFALALWDRQERTLILARDRFGEKPLYYGRVGHFLVFGSELKALRAHPGFDKTVDRTSLAQLLQFSCVPNPRTIYEDIYKLRPGTSLHIRTPADVERAPTPYWSAADVATRGSAERFQGSESDAAEALDALLRRAIDMRMVADVPLGAFLSGGIDSSTIVALMQAQSARRVRTFTIGFAEESYNEAVAAKKVAEHLGTDHTELCVTPEQARDVIPSLPRLYDEPFADSSQIPTHLVSVLARKHVTVALSGDAGDELFGGYNRYAWTQNLWRGMRRVPRGARGLAARALTSVSTATWDSLFARTAPLLPRFARVRLPGDKLHKLAGLLPASSATELYVALLSTWKDSSHVTLGANSPRLGARASLASLTEQMMLFDTEHYLTDDILTKVDRAAMGVSLETRVPLLDPEVFAFAWSLPVPYKVRGARGKLVLRAVLEKYVPRSLFDRPKMGFGVPIDGWLRGPLRDWTEELLSESRLAREGYFDPAPIVAKWREHLSGRRNWQHHLWPVLMFQAWCDEQRAPTRDASQVSPSELTP